MTSLEDALRDYDFAPSTTRHMAAAALAQAVRDHLQSPSSGRRKRLNPITFDDDDLYTSYGSTSNGTRALGLSIIADRPFHYDGILYNTAQNAFQAQKAPKDKRGDFAGIEPMDAVAKGRNCIIDVAAWDANREKLMTLILRAQAEENESMRETLIEWKDAVIVVDDMFDPFWPSTLPAVFQNVGHALAKKPRKDTSADTSTDTSD